MWFHNPIAGPSGWVSSVTILKQFSYVSRHTFIAKSALTIKIANSLPEQWWSTSQTDGNLNTEKTPHQRCFEWKLRGNVSIKGYKMQMTKCVLFRYRTDGGLAEVGLFCVGTRSLMRETRRTRARHAITLIGIIYPVVSARGHIFFSIEKNPYILCIYISKYIYIFIYTYLGPGLPIRKTICPITLDTATYRTPTTSQSGTHAPSW